MLTCAITVGVVVRVTGQSLPLPAPRLLQPAVSKAAPLPEEEVGHVAGLRVEVPGVDGQVSGGRGEPDPLGGLQGLAHPVAEVDVVPPVSQASRKVFFSGILGKIRHFREKFCLL